MLFAVADLGGLAGTLVPFVLILPAAFLGAVGYLVAGQTGAAVGAVGAIALALGAVIWAESGV
ncbi:hypothetical protein R5W24_001121 [Gemmata sp. JC717]|uniref:hypothetical protein n=1 Tax=Gemmata algarum TaxID=2975278 RepID=UPI0021BB8913|nr:hypothetical protein [Gemmata algarum]MDY3552041.1 hypothetical protein [Gemmata algarum]